LLKSFLLKVIEEIAFNENFVVAKITLNRNIPFNKFEEVYKSIVQNLRCKTGTSLQHIITKWIRELEIAARSETPDQEKQRKIVEENIKIDLEAARSHDNSFAMAIENYYNAKTINDHKTAEYAQAWLRCESNIPANEKRKFGVKGNVTKENAFKFLESLSTFLKSIGYEGLVILIDEAEYILELHTNKIRNTAYVYIRNIYDECDAKNFQNTMFIFTGTPDFFIDTDKGIPIYPALYNRLKDSIDSPYRDLRKPIIRLESLKENGLSKLCAKLIKMHGKVYEWNAEEVMNPCIEDIIKIQKKNANFIGGNILPREFLKLFISILDIVEQNVDNQITKEEILKLVEERDELEIIFDKELTEEWSKIE